MTRVAVYHPYLKQPQMNEGEAVSTRTPDENLEEAVLLTQAIETLDVQHQAVLPLSKITPGHFLTKGHLENAKELIEDEEIDLVIFNHALSPIQQRNLERRLKTKVIDRTGLILDIFGARASTKEGKLQVELAALTFQRSRLVRSWTHLERQRGGFGFVGGPGETQIEIDRRLIDEKIVRLKKELDAVKRTRKQQRKSRKAVPFPIVALVGYTNAGKSTLFNAMTGAKVFAKDLLFATLDPTMRAIELEPHLSAILSDTVGFISDLPTHLIAAFRATLEEVQEADVVLHVRDIAAAASEEEAKDVDATLNHLGIDTHKAQHIFEIWNKSDLLGEDERQRLEGIVERRDDVVLTSTLTGEGLDKVRSLLTGYLERFVEEREIELSYKDGAVLSWIYDNCRVMDRADNENIIQLKVSASPDTFNALEQRLSQKQKRK